LTDSVLTHFKQRIQAFTLEPSRGGCFELSVNGKLVYSKLASGRFPEVAEIVAQLERLPAE